MSESPAMAVAAELPRRERRKQEVRNRILQAGAELFEERGCKAATVIEICERADVAKTSFFNHFPSKQDLLCALAVAVFDELVADVERARAENSDTAHALEAFFAHIAGQMAAAGPTAREFTIELIRATQDAGFESDESKRLNAAFERLIVEGRSRGDIDSRHRDDTLAEMISAVYYGLIMAWTQNEDYPIERKAGKPRASSPTRSQLRRSTPMARREVEHTPLPIPNGWFAVAFSRDLIDGGVKSVHYFDEDLVIFRTRSGEVKTLDPYCPHLGAHFGHGGRVVGESIRCPFHGWQYDGSTGACIKIPYCDRIPPAAKVRAWPTQEKNGMIFVWHHDRGEAPSWDFPELPEIGDPDWSEPRLHDVELEAHVQDTHENNNDPVHFQYVHSMTETPPSTVEYHDDGRVYSTVSNCEAEVPNGDPVHYDLKRDSYGLGLVALRFDGIPGAGLLMFSSSTPIDNTRTHSRWVLTSTKNMVDVWGEEFMSNLVSGVQDDFPIWKNKVHRARPVLCEGDTLLADYRSWVKQFYSQPVG